ncbi:MAG: HTH domain-containing protein [Roseburia sp.]|nr:HTH domain-containing protein [Roseburia sp.]
MTKKYDRQIDLLNLLMHGGRTTVYRLSCELGVCTQTVKRDITDLSYHFPIFTYVGRGGGVELSSCFVVNGYIMKRDGVLLIKHSLERLSESADERAAEARAFLARVFHVNDVRGEKPALS